MPASHLPVASVTPATPSNIDIPMPTLQNIVSTVNLGAKVTDNGGFQTTNFVKEAAIHVAGNVAKMKCRNECCAHFLH